MLYRVMHRKQLPLLNTIDEATTMEYTLKVFLELMRVLMFFHGVYHPEHFALERFTAFR